MQKIEFNDNWFFYRDNCEKERVEVSIPHDAMLSEGRSNINPGGKNSAWFAGADYIYEKTFFLTDKDCENLIVFEFEGVYHDAEVYLNGEKAAFRPYGYTNFYVDATTYLKPGQNIIRVLAKNSNQPNCRWYSGAGIYRPVSMYFLPKKHILLNGIKVITKQFNSPVIEVKIDANCVGSGFIEILDNLNKKAVISFENKQQYIADIKLPNAKLWDCENPYLYSCRVNFEGDVQEVMFGIRLIECNSKIGFCINGKRVILRGACIHHDNGLLGAASYSFAESRKIKILKDSGYNAIRAAHNPCSKAILDACDKIGMLVLDEYTDIWYTRKNKYDYVTYFNDWWKIDLSDMVNKDFNHPCVVMYSIGNEVSETAEKKGIELCGEMTKYLHELDSSRPVTCGINIFFNYLSALGFGVHSNKKASKEFKKPKKDKAVGSEFFNNLAGIFGDKTMKIGASLGGSDRKSKDAFAKLDIAGYNYGILRYKKDIKKYPQRVILGSETFCKDAYSFWEKAKLFPALIGDFVWAGMDYIGEVGIGSWVYRDHASDFKGGAGWLTAGSGRIDITGKPTCETSYTKVAFELAKIKLGVVPVNNAKNKHSPSAWKMSNAIESWSWQGCEGKKTIVEVYARAHSVSLFINSKKVRSKKLNDSCMCKFKVKYQSGQLLAIAFDKNGSEIERAELRSAGVETKLSLFPESNLIKSDELCYIRMCYTDNSGVTKPLVRGKIKIDVINGTLLGLGHACPYNADGYLLSETDTYFGEALAIIKPQSVGGITVKAKSKCGDSIIKIEVV